MAEINLEVSAREERGKGAAGRLRRAGKVPAVLYGGDREPVAITVDQKQFTELVAKAEHGARSIFLLKLAGTDQTRHVMLKEVKVDPIKGGMAHIDFVRVVMDQKIKTTVPVHVVGVADGVKNHGGILEFQVRDLHVECLPGQIPDAIEVDVSPLGIHGVLRVSDLNVPGGVDVLEDAERVVISIGVARAEVSVEMAEAEAAAPAEPEVIKKGKTEEEAEEK
jgi:large subunit ribosomal protein L25